ncbi:MAG: IS110 family transposase [Streptomyces sp.]|uniref:IS110 family transposase n=1 Tax=Streptomyces sp. TaxID=1931 RepID=UPI0025EBDD60|nr:IS110 family transposase [Streptomyces sp.]MBW8795073.1 IS110 family transposase [Streptomyces sp.]
MFVGWDWASASHDVTVIDDRGTVIDHWAFEHSEDDFSAALARLPSHGTPAELPVIIERSSGLIVDRLLEAGHPVVPVHPTAFHAARPRWGASGAKSDPGDSYKLADYLRTDGHRLRRLVPVDSGLRELQALVRLRDDHVRARTAAGNQLGALLEQHWPGPKNLFCSLVSDSALNFLTDYPTPQSAARLGEARMAAFCKRHAYRGGKPASALLARLRSAPIAPVSLPADVLTALITAHVQLLRSLQTTIAQLETTIKSRLATHPRALLLAELPGVGTINLAQLLAEVGPVPDRVESAEQAAAECKAAPVTKASGKSHGVYFQWAATTRARKAITAFAHNSRMQSPWAASLYAKARARGKRNPHATRIVARA